MKLPSLRAISLYFVPVTAIALLATARVAGTVSAAVPPQDACPPENSNTISVLATGATHRSVTDASTGSAFFATGQNADILVSGIDFDNTGGSQLYNHPGGIASNGTKLVITDTFNNRVLIWNTPPASNVAPDVVLGQANFTTNNPGTGRAQLNWPMSVSIGGGKLFVTDTNNHRILIWNSIPTVSGTAADVAISAEAMIPQSNNETWPWGIWSDGTKMAVATTMRSRVLIWNTVPTSDNTSPDFSINGQPTADPNVHYMGTPRHVTSNGTMLMVGDHNAQVPSMAQAGTFVWNAFPTSATSPYSFYRQDYFEPSIGPWMKGAFNTDGSLWTFGGGVYSWATPPTSEGAGPTLQLSARDYMKGGDYGGIAFAGGRMYLASGNANRVAVFNTPPTSSSALPDFTIGSTNYCTNTLNTNYFIQNGVPRSNGTNLFVSSDFDRRLYVWTTLPDESNPPPDYVYRLPFQPWSMALRNNVLALAGERTVYIWETLPTAGGLPSRQLRDTIGNVSFQNIKGVAIDANNFYVTDDQADKLYVWSGLPTSSSNPAFSINLTDPWRVTSDGTYLAVSMLFQHQVWIYEVAGLNASSVPIKIIGGPGLQFNGVSDAYVGNGRLFVSDTGFNRIVGWTSLASAIAGGAPDLVIGEANMSEHSPEIGRNKSFSPGTVWYDGRFLWVGEVKFSTRMMRYSPPCSYNMLSAIAQSFPSPAGSGSVTVMPNDSSCAWTASSNASFITVTGGATGTGTGTVSYSVSPNFTGSSRSGTITAGARTFTVTQTAVAPGDPFTDTLTAGTTTIKAVHITELRARIDLLRARGSLGAFSYTDGSVTAGSTGVKSAHISELRTALAQAFTALGVSQPSYTDPTLSSSVGIKAVHISELRAAVVTLEGS